MDIKDAATIAGFVITIGGAGVGYGRMQERINHLEERVAAAEAHVSEVQRDTRLADLIRGLKCYVARLHSQALPDCS